MSSSERSIPHLRDIFGLSGSSGYTMHNNNNQLNSTNYHNHTINHHYQNGNGNGVVSYGVGNGNSNHSNHINNNNNQNGINDHHSSYDAYDNHQTLIDTNALNNNNKKASKKKRDNSKTLTSGDVKTLERHLSMKKTIRKKIMRDLQQAFVEDPNEFRIENINQDQLKAEIRVEALRFGATTGDHQRPARKSDNFLDMLRGEKANGAQLHHPQQQQQLHQYNQTTTTTTNNCNNYNDYTNGSNMNYDYDSPPSSQGTEKQSFWRRFTMKNKTKR